MKAVWIWHAPISVKAKVENEEGEIEMKRIDTTTGRVIVQPAMFRKRCLSLMSCLRKRT